VGWLEGISILEDTRKEQPERRTAFDAKFAKGAKFREGARQKLVAAESSYGGVVIDINRGLESASLRTDRSALNGKKKRLRCYAGRIQSSYGQKERRRWPENERNN
jgi:hypothetical protein